MKRLALLLLITPVPCAAQVTPQAGEGDPRLQRVDYDPGQIVLLRGRSGYQMTVELAPDEEILNVGLGDAGSWLVSVNRERNRLFIKPHATPGPTNMTVITSARLYNFELLPDDGMGGAPYTVRFRFPERPAIASAGGGYVDVLAARRSMSRYKLSGDRLLRPESISDDGERTYVSWPRGRDLPATYEVTPAGTEAIIDGMMRDDVLVIDRLVGKLRFRLDRKTAEARRIGQRERSR